MADPAPTPTPEPAGEPPATPPAAPSEPPDAPAPPAEPPKPPAAPATPEPTPEPPIEGLGDAGKKALQAEREARREADKQLKAALAENAELREAQMSEHEKAIAEARREGETETTSKFQRQLFASKVEVAASQKLADPSMLANPDVALGLLGLQEIPVTADGGIDSEAISKAIDQLTEGRPFLKVNADPAHAKWPSNGTEAGPRGDAKSQLKRDDLRTMTPHQIEAARREGRLDDLLGRKT